MTTKEIFKDIHGYEGYYQISNLGTVKSLARTVTRRDGFKRRVCEKLINPSIQRMTDPVYGKVYSTMTFCLRKDSKTEMYPAAHAVLLAFYPGEYEVGTYKITYKDGDFRNVALNNMTFEYWPGRYGGYVELKKRGTKTQQYRSIAQAGHIMKFEHQRIFDKENPIEKLKGYTIGFAKTFKRKRKNIQTVSL